MDLLLDSHWYFIYYHNIEAWSFVSFFLITVDFLSIRPLGSSFLSVGGKFWWKNMHLKLSTEFQPF